MLSTRSNTYFTIEHDDETRIDFLRQIFGLWRGYDRLYLSFYIKYIGIRDRIMLFNNFTSNST